jgi:hypothetical protein
VIDVGYEAGDSNIGTVTSTQSVPGSVEAESVT